MNRNVSKVKNRAVWDGGY